MFVVWCSGLPGASARPGLSPFVFVVVFGVSFVWGSGASARPGVFVFFPCVVVLVFVFWRSGASACFAAVSLPLGGCRWHGSYGCLWLVRGALRLPPARGVSVPFVG